MEISEIKALLNINEKWKNAFKGDLLENIFEEYEDISVFCNVFTSDWIPCWKLQNKEQIKTYEYFDTEINKLNQILLNEEYSIIRNFYEYAMSLNNCQIATLEDIASWIVSIFDEDEDITLDLLTSTLDEQIFHNGMDS